MSLTSYDRNDDSEGSHGYGHWVGMIATRDRGSGRGGDVRQLVDQQVWNE